MTTLPNRQKVAPFIVALAFATFSSSLKADLFVAPDGDDANPGTEAEPFASLERARQEVRGLNAGMSADLTVQFAPGDYPVTSTIVFDEDDSGMNGYEVVYRSTGDPGSARFLGAQAVTNWQPFQGLLGVWFSVRPLEQPLGRTGGREKGVAGEKGVFGV